MRTEPGRWLLEEYARTPGDPKWYPGMGLETTIIAIEEYARGEIIELVEAALTDEDELAHGEAVADNGRCLGMCAYCDRDWPCPTQQAVDRLLAAIRKEDHEDA